METQMTPSTAQFTIIKPSSNDCDIWCCEKNVTAGRHGEGRNWSFCREHAADFDYCHSEQAKTV
jgi:hypothetical protein